jgi:HSP20 family protein
MPMDKWDPFQEFLKLRNIFNELFERSFQKHGLGEEVGPDFWIPPVDIYDSRDEVSIQMEIPGVRREEIDIEFSGGQLVIKGERLPTYGNGQADYHRIERRHGPFKRIIDLPVPVETESIQASYEHGVLTIVLPIRQDAKAKKIPINVKN